MKTSLPIGLLCGLLLLLIGPPGRPGGRSALAEAQRGESPITVEAASGRTFTGRLDARTNPAQLWVRSQRNSVALRRPIRWDRVVRVRVADQELSAEQFRRIIRQVKAESGAPEEAAAPARRIAIKGSARSGGFLSVTASPRRKPPVPSEGHEDVPLNARPPVRSLALEAAVANWDADVEVDGLLVRVYPLDDTGAVVPVRGMLQLDLKGQRTSVVNRRRPFSTLGRWARPVRPQDFALPSQGHVPPRCGWPGAVYRLPFQGVHPEFDLTVAPYGSLHARLSVPGQGTFETSQSTVRIRPYSAVRDQLQLWTGRRFFPEERTGRGRR